MCFVCVRKSYHLNLPRVQLSRFCRRDGELDFPPFFGFHGALRGTRGIHDALSSSVSLTNIPGIYLCLSQHTYAHTHTRGVLQAAFLSACGVVSSLLDSRSRLLWFVSLRYAGGFFFSFLLSVWPLLFSLSQCLESVWASLYQPGGEREAELRERMAHSCVFRGVCWRWFLIRKKKR